MSSFAHRMSSRWLVLLPSIFLTISAAQHQRTDINDVSIKPQRIMSLNHMDTLSMTQKTRLIDASLHELDFQLAKGRRSLLAAKKKSYYRTVTGTVLYQVSLLLGIGATYWDRTWASTATVANVIGQAMEEAAFDFQGLFVIDIPDLSCVDQWRRNELFGGKLDRQRKKSEDKSFSARQKLRLEMSAFRVNAQKSLSCLLNSSDQIPTESRAISGLLDFISEAIGH